MEKIDIDTTNFHLSENGQPITVEPKVFDLIIYLIQSRDRLVSRQELFDNIWDGRIVSDASLSNHIKSARKTLGDDGKRQQVIKTFHGRGYQFIADIEEITKTTKPPIESKLPPEDDHEKSIAVLAFTDLSPERDQEYFSDGLSEELICLLGKLPELRVISRTSSFSFKHKNTSIQEIGHQLNVTHILEGSVRKAENQLRVTTQLIQVSNESQIWSETFDETLDDIFRIQEHMARSITEQLKIRLTKGMNVAAVGDPGVYRVFLRAKYLAHKFTSDAMTEAEILARQVIAIVPNYAPAWQLLSNILIKSSERFYENLYSRSCRESLKQAKNAAQKAIELNPDFAAAHATLARINATLQDFQAANTHIDIALRRGNRDSEVLYSASVVAICSGRLHEVNKYLCKAIRFAPLEAFYYYAIGLNCLKLNQLSEAVAAFRKCELLHPEHPILYSAMAWALVAQGKYTSAMEEAEKEPHPLHKLFVENGIAFHLGKEKEAHHLLQLFKKKYAGSHPSYVAYLHASRKENDQAFQWLDRAFKQKDLSLPQQINFNQFRNLWHDPRWKVFLEKLELPEDHWLVTDFCDPAPHQLASAIEI